MAELSVVNIGKKLQELTAPWSPIELARVKATARRSRATCHVVRLALFEGEYPKGFHAHDYDELFLCIEERSSFG